MLARDPRAIARAISLIENDAPEAAALVGKIHPHSGQAYLLGVTGPPGAGKSTVVDRLVGEFRNTGRRVGVLAVDPTSPFSGGAILGDRVRMQGHAEDADVFIRSMATRGHLGGLSRATADAALVLDAAGFDLVIIETVGVGQDEVDIAGTADMAIVILVPGTGDDVQALKAGLMEIADVFVVNKADREGADRLASSVEAMQSLAPVPAGSWRPPVLRTVGTTGAGLSELMATIARFRAEAAPAQHGRRRARAKARFTELLSRDFVRHVETGVLAPGEEDRLVDDIAERRTDPYAAAAALLARALAPGTAAGMPGREAAVLDHVGVAVADAAPYADLFRVLFQLETTPPEDVGHHRLRFVETGASTIELVEPGNDEAPIAKFLRTKGSGLHHVCLRVLDLDAALAALDARGIRLIDRVPRPGAHGSRIAFLHPSSTAGLLIELKEMRRDDPPASGGAHGERP